MALHDAFTRAFDPDTGRLIDEQAKNNIVEFLTMETPDDAATAKKGYPVFRSIECIRIIVPGDNKNIVERIAQPADRVQYARQYEAFKRQEEISIDGYSIDHWAPLTNPVRRIFKHFNVFTVEQIANLSDTQLSGIGILGGRQIRTMAQAHLEAAKTGAVPIALVNENEQLKQQIKRLESQIADANSNYETLLKSKGMDASAVAAVTPAPNSPAAPQVAAPAIPKNWRSLDDKALIGVCRTAFGVTPANRKEAEAMIKEEIEGK